MFFYFHPLGYSIAAQARKLVHEKNPYLKIVGFIKVDLNYSFMEKKFKTFLERVDKKRGIATSKYLPYCDVLFLVLADQLNEGWHSQAAMYTQCAETLSGGAFSLKISQSSI